MPVPVSLLRIDEGQAERLLLLNLKQYPVSVPQREAAVAEGKRF